MKNSKNKRLAIMGIALLVLLVVAYKMIFVSDSSVLLVDENIGASQRVETILQQVESINFDTSVIENPEFKSLQTIEIPLATLPVGRSNPFAPISGSN